MSARTPHRRRRPIRRTRPRGVILGIVLILIAVIFAAGLFALWSTRTDTASAGHDRLARQLFDCSEQGLAWGKQYFSTTGRTQWSSYLAASNACSTSGSTRALLPCAPNGPFPAGGSGSPVAGYPGSAPYTQQIQMESRLGTGVNDFEFTVGIYNDPADATPWADTNNRIVVYSRCTDLSTLQSRSVQAILTSPMPTSSDYTGQAGRGFRNQGNQNF
ncbi:MAG: hypothetical protein ACXVDD_11955 [Polyangia bacterium]